MDSDREARALQRRLTWSATLSTQHTPTQASDSTPTTRLASLWSLSLDAWAISGRPLPEYQRADMPGKVVRRTEKP